METNLIKIANFRNLNRFKPNATLDLRPTGNF